MDRLTQLLQFLKDEPNDPFLRYALSLEYLKLDPAKAEKEFKDLMKQHPAYLPTYYPAAHLMIELGKDEEAEQLFNHGINLAKEQGDSKMQLELKSAFEIWKLEKG